MTTKEFLKIAPKITSANIFTNAKKGEHVGNTLGYSVFGSTERHYRMIWRKYGTLRNIVILDKAENVNNKLEKFGITEFKAKPTKSGNFSRLHTIK